ncbi:MAG: UDP-N-acetylglucosamine 2-epimerase, partial [Desulfobacterales bacterium]|nr:UDP-N-acetylglucosamine 2-epimerase [Desulfobacterales bacterium]
MKRKVCVLTGTRAEYGLFSKLLRDIRLDPELELQIIATCAHLSPEFGLTFKEIENDGFNIDKKIEMLLSSDTPVGVSKSMGLAHIGFSEAIEELRPDMLMLLGDRFETFCAAATACIACIPIAHIHGGEITEGSVDDALRHAITKMSHLHFTSTETYRNRVIQLGERPEHVFNVGSLGVENLKDLNLITKNEIENRLGFKFAAHPIMVTFHPATLEYEQSEKQFECLLRAIDRLQDIQIIFTKSNADAGGRVINGMIDRYVSEHPSKAISFISMGHHLYFNTMRHVRVFMGNSSSGII